jgi:hypothetical protein
MDQPDLSLVSGDKDTRNQDRTWTRLLVPTFDKTRSESKHTLNKLFLWTQGPICIRICTRARVAILAARLEGHAGGM